MWYWEFFHQLQWQNILPQCKLSMQSDIHLGVSTKYHPSKLQKWSDRLFWRDMSHLWPTISSVLYHLIYLLRILELHSRLYLLSYLLDWNWVSLNQSNNTSKSNLIHCNHENISFCLQTWRFFHQIYQDDWWYKPWCAKCKLLPASIYLHTLLI